MSDVGKWVVSFHKFPDKGLREPYDGQILEDLRSYWVLKVGKQKIRAFKGACSSVPFAKNELGTQEYADAVRTKTKAGKAVVGTPEADNRKSKKAEAVPRPKRRRNSKDTPSADGVRGTKSKGWGSVFGSGS